MKKTIAIRMASTALAVLGATALTSCSEDDSKTSTDIVHDVETLESEVDSLLAEIDEVDTIESVSAGILSD
jgi:outer membrane murein-binding lipoprotein Lpp